MVAVVAVSFEALQVGLWGGRTNGPPIGSPRSCSGADAPPTGSSGSTVASGGTTGGSLDRATSSSNITDGLQGDNSQHKRLPRTKTKKGGVILTLIPSLA